MGVQVPYSASGERADLIIGLFVLSDYLCHHQDVQNQVRAELKAVFGNVSTIPKDSLVSATLPRVDALVHEVLRHMPIIPCHIRTSLVDTQLLGHFIPKGTSIFMPVSSSKDFCREHMLTSLCSL